MSCYRSPEERQLPEGYLSMTYPNGTKLTENGTSFIDEEFPHFYTIQDTALHLLCYVDYYFDKNKTRCRANEVPIDHPNAKSMGLQLGFILDILKKRFPESGTTGYCLHSYIKYIREKRPGCENFRLPWYRPSTKWRFRDDEGRQKTTTKKGKVR